MTGILSISRPNERVGAYATSNGQNGVANPDTGARKTATYLSEESLTFPGMTGVASILVLLYARATNQPPTDVVVLGAAVLVGAALTVIGLLDPSRKDKGRYATFVQLVIGFFNTALLAAAVLGVSSVTS
jgi:hypothetical protein